MGYFKTKNAIYCNDNYKVSARSGELIPSSNFSRYNIPNGMGLLSAPIELNNQIVTPLFRHFGGDASITEWPVDIYGTDIPIASSGTNPSVNSGSPCFGIRDDGVRINAGKSYQQALAATYNLTTEDFILEWFARNHARQTGYFLTKYDGSKGFYIDYLSAGSVQITLVGADGSATINSGALYFGNEWDFWQLIVNKNGYAQYSFNGVLVGTPVDVSGVGSLTNTAKVTLCDRWDLAAPIRGDFAYIAMYAKIGWLATHNLPDFVAERHYQVTGLLPLSSRGTSIPVTATRASSAYIQKDTNAVPRLYYVGTNYIRLERYTDLNGVEKVCENIEHVAEENKLLRNNQWENAAWTKRGGATADHYTTETTDPLTTNWGAVLSLGFESTPVDIYQTLAAGIFTNDAVLAVSMWVKKKTATGTLVLTNPTISSRGRWEIDVSGLPDYWIRIDRAFMNTYGTVVNEFQAQNNGAAGLQLYNKVDAVLEIYVWNPMQIENGSYQTGSDITETITTTQSRAAEVYEHKLDDGVLVDAMGSIQFDLLLPNATPLAPIEILKITDNRSAADQLIFEVQTDGTITCTMDATGGSQRIATVAGDCADGLWHRFHLLWETGRFIIRRDNVAGTNISATIEADIPDDLNLLTRLNARIANIQLWNRAYYPGA